MSERDTEIQVILELYSGFSILNKNEIEWTEKKIKKDICELPFISCFYGHRITHIDLSKFSLEGTLPKSLGNLTHLQTLVLSNNYLKGTIPTEIGKLSSLRILNLHHNSLTGTIPSELGHMHYLEELRINDNFLTGSLHENIRKKMLHFMYISNNHFDCPFPYFSSLNLNDNEEVERICEQACENKCEEGSECYIQGHDYKKFGCKESIPCSSSLSPTSGIPNDEIFVFGSSFYQGEKVICMFGEIETIGIVYDSRLAQCTVPLLEFYSNSNIPLSVDIPVKIKINGKGENCGAFFTYSEQIFFIDSNEKTFQNIN